MRTVAPRMPFGRFKGARLVDLPDWYLCWLHNLTTLREPLRLQVAREYERRLHPRGGARRRAPAHPPLLSPELRATAAEVIAAGFRVLAHQRHPDHDGGGHAAMVVLIAARDALVAWLEDAR